MGVLIFNNGYDVDSSSGELLDVKSLKHALTMIHRGVADPVELTMLGSVIVPSAVELTRYIYPAWVERRREGTVGFSYRAVHERDHWTCAYCGKHVSKKPRNRWLLATVDHVMPLSRGGPTSWMNLVSSCMRCNNVKGGRTPEEAGMSLRFEPFDPTLGYRVGGHVERIPELV
jgi:hypothetical protein